MSDGAGLGLDTAFAGFVTATSPWEVAAVFLAVVYLVLAIREHPGCWPAAILSSLIYIALLGKQQLYMESALQMFYVAMAIYGWWAWRPAAAGEGGALVVHTWPWRNHVIALLLVAVLAAASGRLLVLNTNAALPYLDSSITWGSLLATWMVTRKVLENWLYWFVIDSLSLGAFLNRGLYLTAALFALYLVLIIIGYRAWRRSMHKNVP
ncbi:MAG: nicotinamide riboside transporter PnuC [Gammaproteobacteria bacterium]